MPEQSNQKQPPQHQEGHGAEQKMQPQPQDVKPDYRAAGKLTGKVALVTGGDSGIGRAVCILFAKEGADVAFIYHESHEDAQRTRKAVEAEGRRCYVVSGDIGDEAFCQQAVQQTVRELGRLDVLANVAGEQQPRQSIEDISDEQLQKTFRTNVFAMFYLVKAALPHLKPGSAIVNTASVTAYQGSPELLDYSSTKGAIVAFTRSLAESLVERGIRVNGVAPGPIWTPLIVSTFPEEKVASFGKDTPMKRAGQPSEVAPCFVFLASDDSSYITGQFLHPNGGRVVNG
jgi:NAD(P)-dependent dehydrogenase (short-subunit alcohol dehydrogenase family)